MMTTIECESIDCSPHRAPRVNDKSLDSHLSPNDLDSATRRAPNRVEYLELLISLLMEHHKSPAVPFSGNPFLLDCPVDCNSIDYQLSMTPEVDSILSGHATIPKALETHTNNELDYLAFKKK